MTVFCWRRANAPCRAVSLRVHLARQGRGQRGKAAPLEARTSAVHAALAGVLPRWRSVARIKPICRERVLLALARSDAKIRQSVLKSRKGGGVQILLVQAALVISKTCVRIFQVAVFNWFAYVLGLTQKLFSVTVEVWRLIFKLQSQRHLLSISR